MKNVASTCKFTAVVMLIVVATLLLATPAQADEPSATYLYTGQAFDPALCNQSPSWTCATGPIIISITLDGIKPGYTGSWPNANYQVNYISVGGSTWGTVLAPGGYTTLGLQFDHGSIVDYGFQTGGEHCCNISISPGGDNYELEAILPVNSGSNQAGGTWQLVPNWHPGLFYKQAGHPLCGCGDPINIANGNVYEEVTDYSTAGSNKLSFTRYYNSLSDPNSFATSLGSNWRSNYDRYLRITYSLGQLGYVTAERPDGQMLQFTANDGSWATDSDVDVQLVQSGSTWTLTDHSGEIETYAQISPTEALLTTIQTPGGYTQNLTYDAANQLTAVTDMYGKSFNFTYTGRLLQAIRTPDNQTLTFDYAAISLNGNNTSVLKSIKYPTTPITSVKYSYRNLKSTAALTGIIDENGDLYASWTYDSSGRGLSSQHAGGVDITNITYNNDSYRSRLVTNALGEKELYKFDNSYLPKVIEIDRHASSNFSAAAEYFAYDAYGYLASKQDWDGNTTSFVNNVQGLPTQIIEAGQRVTKIAWNTTYRKPTAITTAGLQQSFTYDAQGAETSRTDVSGSLKRTWTMTWNNALLMSVTGPRGDVAQTTRFNYDTLGSLIATSNALGQVTSVTSNTGGGRPLTIVDPNGVTTRFAYDARQRLLAESVVTSTGSYTTALAYDRDGDLISTTLPDKSYLTNTYDPAHRLIMSENALGGTIAYTLDALGDRTATAIGKAGSAVTWQQQDMFDAIGRTIAEQRGAGQTTSFTYDANGQPLTVTDPLSRVTTRVFDALGRVTQITDPAKGVTRIAYDAHDRITSVVAPNAAKTTYTRDGFGRVVKRTSPDTGVTQYSYDLADNLVQSQDAAGIVTNYAYDALNRLVSTSYPADAAESVTRIYDEAGHGFGVGHLTSVVDAVGKLSLTYDERGNELSETRVSGGAALTTGYTYDAASRIASITYPSGLTATYARDKAGQVVSIKAKRPGASALTTIISSVAYLPFGPPSAMTYGSGLAEGRSYDLAYRLMGLTDGSVQGLSYSYDAADNVKAIADAINAGNSQAFSYDALDRLTAATGAYGGLGWGYDKAGNRTSQTVTGGTASSYTYRANSNVLTGIASAGKTTAVTTSLAGNILAITPPTGNPTGFVFNQAERLAEVQTGSTVVDYAYDAFGHRFSKTLSSGQSLFSYGQSGELLEEATGTGALKTDTIYLNGAPVATITPNAVFFLHGDKLGTPQVATTTAKAVAWRAAYQPFGTNTGAGGLFTQNLRFPGQYADAEDSLYQNGFRDYNPSWGRYIESDPTGLLGGSNTFGYVGQNPLKNVDRLGLYDSMDFEIDALQALAGFSDIVTLGASNWARNELGTNYADPCGGAYQYGKGIGIGASLLYGVGELGLLSGGVDAAATEGSVDAFTYYMNAAKTLDVSTAENGAVFYSGPGNRALAEEFAMANGRTTLEMTSGGSWLDAQNLYGPGSPLTRGQAGQVWSTLSERFASEASGNAVGFVHGASPAGIFSRIEYPTLVGNPRISNVFTGGY